MPQKDHDILDEYDVAFKPLNSKCLKGEINKKRKIGEKGESSKAERGKETSTPPIQTYVSLSGWEDELDAIRGYFKRSKCLPQGLALTSSTAPPASA